MHEAATAEVEARVGLLGNPSDGYGGRVLAATINDFGARVHARRAERWALGPAGGLVATEGVGPPGAELLVATVAVLERHRPALVAEPLELSFESTIPRQVGLSGSSAIIIAALRSVAELHGAGWDRVDLARTALSVEVDELGWAAGPQDRVVQSYGGALDMDFADPWQADKYVRLDPERLPTFVLLWDEQPGEASTVAHRDVRSRWLAGETEVVDAMGRFATLAAEGRAAIDAGELEVWPDLLDQAYELRARFWNLRERDVAMINLVRAHGFGGAFAGSGGAIVAVARDPSRLDALASACAAQGFGSIVPTVGDPTA